MDKPRPAPPPLRPWSKRQSYTEGRWFYLRELDSSPTVGVATIIDCRKSGDDLEPDPWGSDRSSVWHATPEAAMAAVDRLLVAEGWTLL